MARSVPMMRSSTARRCSFESGNVTPVSIMDIVNNKADAYFYIEKQLPDDVRDAGRRCVKAFDVKSRFIHFEFFPSE